MPRQAVHAVLEARPVLDLPWLPGRNPRTLRVDAADDDVHVRAGRVGVGGADRVVAVVETDAVEGLDAKAAASLAGARPRHATVRHLARPKLHPGRPGAGATNPLHPAVTAMRCNPDLRAKYRQLVAQGKPAKVALVAVMRKLLVLANALLEQDRTWVPERPGQDRTPSAGDAALVAA